MSSPLIQSVSSLPPFQQYMRRLSDSFSLSQTNVDPIQEIVWLQFAHHSYFNTAVVYSLGDSPVRGLESSFTALFNSSTQVLLIHVTDQGKPEPTLGSAGRVVDAAVTGFDGLDLISPISQDAIDYIGEADDIFIKAEDFSDRYQTPMSPLCPELRWKS
ncbi:hypothetical protein F5J12DRAFT_895060 [Pisolithus orientalis]|uniref:uncharacterized protein n=1 Tax=Pisolithus orientalis TaxID=936130 RepID=UPI002223FBFB|nr:uncharacterized protein F5J12DRAFT_895060 [Pisolithus orientalis]KAI5999812.1 hypothetical protein F5J12DRAFT_895060 [Pisolithus orientalis]